MKRLLTIALAAAAIAVGVVLYLRAPSPNKTDAQDGTEAGQAHQEHPRRTDQTTAAAASESAPKNTPQAGSGAKMSAEERLEILAKIFGKYGRSSSMDHGDGQPEGPSKTRTHDSDLERLGSLDAQYIKTQIQEIKPLIRECYDNELAQGKKMQGRIVVRFEVLADEELGGVISGSEILESGSVASESLEECVRENMYALKLKAPKNAGKITVTYPFAFSQAQKSGR